MTISPACLIGGLATPQGASASSTVNGSLASTAGVVFWFLTCIGTDETSTPAGINASLSVNASAKTFSFTSGAAGTAYIFQSTVGIGNLSSLGQGRDANNVIQSAYTTTFKVYVQTANGYVVLADNETIEQNATFGWIQEVNQAIRAISGNVVVVPTLLRLSSNTTLTQSQSGYVCPCDTTSASFTVKLPTGSNAIDGVEYTLVDSKNKWATNALTVTTDVGTVPIVDPLGVGSSGDTQTSLTLSSARASVRFKYLKSPENLYIIV